MRWSMQLGRAVAVQSLLSLSLAAQDLIAPTAIIVRTRPSAQSVTGEHDSKPDIHGFDGSGVNFAAGDKRQTNVETKVLTGRFFGPLTCEAKAGDAEEKCSATTLFSFEINSYIVDAGGQQVVALKEYLMSSKGAPLSLRIPLDWSFFRRLNFNTYHPGHDNLPQSWLAGKFLLDARLIPLRLASGTSEYNYSALASAALEGHLAFEAFGSPGTMFFTLAPSFGFALGDSLRAALLPPGAVLTGGVWSLAYSGGYQFGGPDGTAFRFGGAVALKDLRGGKGQITVGVRKALSALTPSPRNP